MKRTLLTSPRLTTTTTLAFLGFGSLGCPNSGLDAYNKDDPEVVEDGGAEGDSGVPPEFPPIGAEDCADACVTAQLLYSQIGIGCTVECDINLGTSYEGVANATIITLLASGWFDVDGEFHTGETCDIVPYCPEPTPCQSIALSCLADASSEPETCMSEYLACAAAELCQTDYDDCTDVILDEYDDCTDPPDDCLATFEAGNEACLLQYEGCLGVSAPAPLPPPPQMTAPGRYDVPMGFIAFHLQRLELVDGETFAMVMPNAQGVPSSLRLEDIQSAEVLALLGLVSGDRVLAVNDVPVLTFVDHPTLLLPIINGPGVKLTIRRNGTNRELRYRFVK